MTTNAVARPSRPIAPSTTALMLLLVLLTAISATDLPHWNGFASSAALLFKPRVAEPLVPTPAATLEFSSTPSDSEFAQVGLFLQPLVPLGTTTPEENRLFASALKAYEVLQRRHDYDRVESLEAFLHTLPRSAWRASLLVGLGATYRSSGRMSKALEAWQAAWDLSKGFDSGREHSLGDAVAGYLSQLEAYLGRKETLAPLLAELRNRPIYGSARQMVSNSASGLDDMFNRPEESFRCGPLALQRFLESLGAASVGAAIRVLLLAKSSPQGLSAHLDP